MKFKQFVAASAALMIAACSSGPTSPTSESAARTSLLGGEGIAGSAAIATDRVRLRRVGGGDIRTGLVTGQIIDVPLNVKLDVWAEIVRLEADRARLLVNWGNGNTDFTGCGSCRLENTYTQPGRYTLTISVLDLNAPSGTPPVTFITVTLNVYDFAALACSPATMDFEAFPSNLPPYAAAGITVASSIGQTGSGASIYAPELAGIAFLPGAPTTVTFDSDKNSFSMGIATVNPPGPVSYQAFDASGTVVASGSATASTPVSGNVKGTLSFSSSSAFRSVVLTTAFSFGAIAYDNISGRCQ